MSAHRPFSGLAKDWSPERIARSEARKAALAADGSAGQPCGQINVSQDEPANVTDMQPPMILGEANLSD
jgi:hypothetical protein